MDLLFNNEVKVPVRSNEVRSEMDIEAIIKKNGWPEYLLEMIKEACNFFDVSIESVLSREVGAEGVKNARRVAAYLLAKKYPGSQLGNHMVVELMNRRGSIFVDSCIYYVEGMLTADNPEGLADFIKQQLA